METNRTSYALPVAKGQHRTPAQKLAQIEARDLQRKWGYAWNMIGETFREGEIAKRILMIVSSRADSDESIARLFETWQQMRADLDVE